MPHRIPRQPLTTIRRATRHDLDSMVHLLQMLFTIEASFEPAPERQRAGLKQMLRHPRQSCIMVAETIMPPPTPPRIIGMCTGQLVTSTAQGTQSLWIEDLIIESAWRNHGYGRQLLEAIISWGKGEGATRAQLLAENANLSAINFYTYLGWERTDLNCWRKMLCSS